MAQLVVDPYFSFFMHIRFEYIHNNKKSNKRERRRLRNDKITRALKKQKKHAHIGIKLNIENDDHWHLSTPKKKKKNIYIYGG